MEENVRHLFQKDTEISYILYIYKDKAYHFTKDQLTVRVNHSLVALVLAMQADAFVITSGSNWSRLMEELCLGKDLEQLCAMVDVTPWRPHDW